MGMIGSMLGIGRSAERIGNAVTGVAEVFVGNQANRDEAAHEARAQALRQHAAEFTARSRNAFDRFVDGLNRLPRPMLALGTLGLFAYAMADPQGFSMRMEGLAFVPEPLWWLLGANVSFYFGARELHYVRRGSRLPAAAPANEAVTTARAANPARRKAEDAPAAPRKAVSRVQRRSEPVAADPVEFRADDPHFNAALEEWRRSGQR